MKLIAGIFLAFTLFGCMGMSKFSRGKLVHSGDPIYSFPFESIDGIIVVKATVNGIEGRFLLDNGFSLCALDKSFAEKANVSFEKTGTVNDANNNRIELKESKIASIAIGPYELRNAYGNLLQTSKFLPCDSIDGVIGASFINRVNWTFDFEQRIAGITTASPSDTLGLLLPFRTANNNISHTVIRIGEKDARAMIDFGYQGHVQLKKELFIDQLVGKDAEVRSGIHSLSVSGLGNIDTSYIFRNVSLSNESNALTPTSELTLKSTLKRDAVIGINYFENYRLVINNKKKTYLLQPRDSYTPPIKQNFNASLYVMDSTIKVLQVNINDPLLSDLQLLQTVVSIDGVSASQFLDVCKLKSYFQEKRDKKESVMIAVEGHKRLYEIQCSTVERIAIFGSEQIRTE